MSEPWVFGVAPLAETEELAPLLRRVAELAIAQESSSAAVGKLIADLRSAEAMLAESGPADPTPRLGPAMTDNQRIYLDHGRHVGSYNPCFPEYTILVDGPRASGEVSFPLAFEGPPGLVHGGVLAGFFDSVIQHHNCDVGVAGKTASLLTEYRRPTPLLVPLRFEIDRELTDRRIVSTARLLRGDELLCTATLHAVVGDRSNLPAVSPRRGAE